MSRDGIREVAERWLPAFLAGERADASLYAERVVTWHNIGEHETVVEAPPSAARARRAIPDLHHEDVRLHVHDGGFVLQVTAVGTGPGGEAIRVPSCLVVTVEGGRITRFEEYADSVAAAPVVAAITAADAPTAGA